MQPREWWANSLQEARVRSPSYELERMGVWCDCRDAASSLRRMTATATDLAAALHEAPISPPPNNPLPTARQRATLCHSNSPVWPATSCQPSPARWQLY